MLKTANRLQNPKAIKALFFRGNRYNSPLFQARFLAANHGQSQILVAVSTKISKKAVTRNRIKRRIKSAFLSQLSQLPPLLIGVLGKQKILTISFEELQKEVLKFSNFAKRSRLKTR
jgi:ribonuclease P protein component